MDFSQSIDLTNVAAAELTEIELTINPMNLSKHTSKDDDNKTSNNHPTNPVPLPSTERNKYQPIGSIVSFFLFLSITGSVSFLYVLVDIYLADKPPHNAVEQNKWNNRWWSLPRLQSFFVFGLFCSIAEIVLQCARNKRKKKVVDRISIDIYLVLFVILLIVQFGYPKSYQKERKETLLDVSRGNCSASSDLHFQKVCPSFGDDAFFQVSEGLLAKVPNTDPLAVLNTLDKLWEYGVLIRTVTTNLPTVGSSDEYDVIYPSALNLVKNLECIQRLPTVGCELFFDRCKYSDCKAIPAVCFDDGAYEKWRMCGINTCKDDPTITSNCDIPHHVVKNVVDRFYKVLQRSTGSEVASALEVQETTMILYLVENLQIIAQKMDLKNQSQSNCEWIDLKTESTTNRSISCDLNVTQYEVESKLIYVDQAHVIISTMVILSIMILFSGNYPTLPRPGKVRVLSTVMGMLVSLLTFVAALNVERASHLQTESIISQKVSLEFWSSIYFLVSWACLNHAMFMLFPDVRHLTAAETVKKNCLLLRSCCRCVSKSVKKARTSVHSKNRKNMVRQNSKILHTAYSFKKGYRYMMKEVISTRGKWFMFRMYAKEIFESVFQLLGIIDTAAETDVFFVYGMVMLVALNFVVLNFLNLLLRKTFGHIVATGVVVLTESLFDKAFLILSVFARDTTIVVSGTTLWQQLLRHGVTLLPAISFAINKSSFVSLYNEYIASMEEAKRLSIKEEEKKEEKKKKGSDNNTIMRRRRASSFADSSFRENMYVKRTVQLVSPFIILVGMVLGIYITGRVYTQRSQCLDLVGPIATCMQPTLYFENGFFGTTNCGFANVTSVDCHSRFIWSQNQLFQGVTNISDSTVYSEMIRLKAINISHTPSLQIIPWSWGDLPSLETLDVSHTGLVNLPYSICGGKSRDSLNKIVLDDTPASKKLNWTGQIRRHGHSKMLLSIGCDTYFRSNLQELILVNNQLTCPFNFTMKLTHGAREYGTDLEHRDANVYDEREDCGFSAVQHYEHLSFLDLSYNNISTIRIHLHKLIVKNQLKNESSRGIVLTGNPIYFIDFNAMLPAIATNWFRFLATLSNPALVTRISAKILSITSTNNQKVLSGSLFSDCNCCAEDSKETCPLIENLHIERFNSLEYLTLNHNFVSAVDRSMFQNMKKLRSIALRNNRISILKKDTFVDLSKLEYIDVESNPALILEPGVFNGLNSLWYLNLEPGLSMATLPANLFVNLPQLWKLLIQSDQLIKIEPGCFKNLPKLWELHISKTSIETIVSDQFGQLPSLQSLDITRSNVQTIGDHAFFGLKDLVYLYLYRNQIETVNSSMFAGLNKLIHLNLENNKLKMLRNNTFDHLPALQILDVGNNNIHTIDVGTFLPLVNLKWLGLFGNPLFANGTRLEDLGIYIRKDVYICYTSTATCRNK